MELSSALASIYLSLRGADDPCRKLPSEDLERQLRGCLSVGEGRGPELGLRPERFIAHLAACVPKDAEPAALPPDRLAELYLCSGCAEGLPRAQAHFEAQYLRAVPGYVLRLDATPTFGQEVLGLVRDRLLLPDAAGRRRIAEYKGRGPLGGWVRTVAMRAALNLRRAGKARREAPEAEAIAPLGADAELDYIRRRYETDFTTALRESFGALPAVQQNLLRLHFSDGLSTRRLGALLGIDGSTAVRRLKEAREAVFSETKRRLRSRLGVDSGEFESLARVLHAALEQSLSGMLRGGG